MKNKVVNLAFILMVLIFLQASLVRTVFFPIEINTYENRIAETLDAASIEGFIDGAVQDNMEDALSDQAFFSQDLKKAYNSVQSGYMHSLVSSLAEKNSSSYINLGGIHLFGRDCLVYGPSSLKIVSRAMRERANEYNRMFKKHSDIDFYLYYVEKDVDIDFEKNEKVGIYDYLSGLIKLPEENKAAFQFDSFEEFRALFYKTDHHWNADGSYIGYEDVIGLLLSEDEPLIPKGEAVKLSDDFSGSKTMGERTAGFKEEFWVYQYDYPEMTFMSNGIQAPYYGRHREYFSGELSEVHYSDFYGYDFGETILDTGNPEKENLLIIGESYDNAILKLVAGHFNRTVAIDLRYYEPNMGKEFSLDECLEVNEIDKVLLMGNADYFTSESFSLEK